MKKIIFVILFLMISTIAFSKNSITILLRKTLGTDGHYRAYISILCINGYKYVHSYGYRNGSSTVQIKDKDNNPVRCK